MQGPLILGLVQKNVEILPVQIERTVDAFRESVAAGAANHVQPLISFTFLPLVPFGYRH